MGFALRILVSAFLDKNLGDDAMIKMLAKELSDHELYLACADPVLAMPFEGIKNLRTVRLERNLLRRWRQLRQFDAYIRIGGSIFEIHHYRQLLSKAMQLPVWCRLKRRGAKYAIIGCNLGPFGNWLCKRLALWEIGGTPLVTVRDMESYGLLADSKGISSLLLFPDMVLSLPLDNMALEIPRNCLGISAYRSDANRELNYRNYMKMAEIADNYIRRTGQRVLLFAFDSESENDVAAAYNIKHFAREKERIEVHVYTGRMDDVVSNMARCKSFVAVRFHSAIIAMRLGIPFIPVVYANKTDNMLDDIGYCGWRIPMSEIGDVDASSVVDYLLRIENIPHDPDPILFERSTGHMKAVKAFIEDDGSVLSKMHREVESWLKEKVSAG